MAIKYPGTNLIGYGEAQVWKDRDNTKLAREQIKKQCPKGSRWDGQKCSPLPKKEDILSDLDDIDVAKVRNAELTGDNNLYAQKDNLLAFGVKYMSQIQDKSDGGKYYLEFEKMKNNFRKNIILSANQKLEDEEVYNTMMDDENFNNEDNLDMWQQTKKTSMFSPEWNDSTEPYTQQEIYSAHDELDQKYVDHWQDGNPVMKSGMDIDDYNNEKEKLEEGILAGRPVMGVGNLYNNIKPDFNFNTLIKEAVENMDPTEIASQFAGKTKSGHDTYYDRQKVDQNLARQSIYGAFEGHQYSNYIKKDVEEKAAALGLSVDDYITQLAEPHLETKMSVWRGIKPASMRVNVSTATTTPSSRGSLIERGQDFDYSVGANTFTYTTTSAGVSTAITESTRGKRFFIANPTKTHGYQLLKSVTGGAAGGYKTSGSAINFVPNTIEWYHTASSPVTGADGNKYVQGEMIPDDAVAGWDAEKKKKMGIFSSPWIKGVDEKNNTEYALRFTGTVKSQYEQWYLDRTDAKDAESGLKELLAKANLKPNPKRR